MVTPLDRNTAAPRSIPPLGTRDEGAPLVSLRQLLEHMETCVKKATHVPYKKQTLGRPAYWPERCSKLEYVSNERTARGRDKEMIVLKTGEGAANHRISKMARSVVRGNPACQL